jgi:hypothetical protein
VLASLAAEGKKTEAAIAAAATGFPLWFGGFA